MKKYALSFALLYLLLSSALFAALFLLDMESSLPFGTVIILCCSFFVAGKFVKDEGRRPSPREAIIYSALALLAIWLVSFFLLLVVLVVMLPPELLTLQTLQTFITERGTQPRFIILGFVLASFFSYLVTWGSFSWYTKLAFRQLQKTSPPSPSAK